MSDRKCQLIRMELKQPDEKNCPEHRAPYEIINGVKHCHQCEAIYKQQIQRGYDNRSGIPGSIDDILDRY